MNEKTLLFWNFDLKGFLGGFGRGFGRPKSSIFAVFSMFFRRRFRSAFRRAKKSTKNSKKPNFSAFWRRVCGVRDVPGEGLKGGETRDSQETLATRPLMLVSGV